MNSLEGLFASDYAEGTLFIPPIVFFAVRMARQPIDAALLCIALFAISERQLLGERIPDETLAKIATLPPAISSPALGQARRSLQALEIASVNASRFGSIYSFTDKGESIKAAADKERDDFCKRVARADAKSAGKSISVVVSPATLPALSADFEANSEGKHMFALENQGSLSSSSPQTPLPLTYPPKAPLPEGKLILSNIPLTLGIISPPFRGEIIPLEESILPRGNALGNNASTTGIKGFILDEQINPENFDRERPSQAGPREGDLPEEVTEGVIVETITATTRESTGRVVCEVTPGTLPHSLSAMSLPDIPILLSNREMVKRQKPLAKTLPDFVHLFDRYIWGPHPRQRGSRARCLVLCGNMAAEDFLTLIGVIPQYIAQWREMVKDGEACYIPHPETFLRRVRQNGTYAEKPEERMKKADRVFPTPSVPLSYTPTYSKNAPPPDYAPQTDIETIRASFRAAGLTT